MNLRQLQFVRALVQHNLNVTAAADSLHTSQPGVSKQIRQLEDELGLTLFERHGKQLTRVTPAGERVVDAVFRVLDELDNLKATAAELNDPSTGTLSIATTHTQARYALPNVIERFRERYPRVTLDIHEGTPAQLAQWALAGDVDFVIGTEAFQYFENLVVLPCYLWRHLIVAPVGHALTRTSPLTLEAVAGHPLLTHITGLQSGSPVDVAFRQRDLEPDIVLSAASADVIKTYVGMGLGIGIIAATAYDEKRDSELVALDAAHLFEPCLTQIGLRRGVFLKAYIFDFIELFAPHLTRDVVYAALRVPSHERLAALFSDVELPIR